MFKQILLAMLLTGVGHAATTVIFLVNGKEVSPTQALMASTNGEQVYKCQLVTAHLSKSGTSISLKAKK
jgi:hypothetical protein